MTQNLSTAESPDFQVFRNSKDILTDLEHDENLPEAHQPSALKTMLFKHQRQALSFMTRREQGWNFHGQHPDLWRIERSQPHHVVYVNIVTDEKQYTAPLDFRGGIIGDQMGLGKSLTAIALAAQDKDVHTGEGNPVKDSAVKATLIVVRAPLLHTWKHQLQTHLRSDKMQWRTHHGQDRIRCSSDLNNIDVIITTYHTLCAEHRKSAKEPSIMFAVHWHRLVLDEAHDIRDHSRLTARAMRELKASRRWALTGTPIQNNLLDLASLYQFLRIEPYTEPSVFKEHVSRLCHQDRPDAMERIRRLVCCIMLRRPISHVTLPPRTDLTCKLDFSPEEKELYDRAKANTLKLIDDGINGSSSDSSPLNILAWINSLRMICNLGTRAKLRRPSVHDQAWNLRVAQDMYNSLVAAGTASCTLCNTDLTASSIEVADKVTCESNQPYLSKTSDLLCNTCYLKTQSDGNICAPFTSKDMLPVSTLSSTLHLEDGDNAMSAGIPTKIATLLQDLRLHIEEEKCIVFSFWTSTLDIVEECLRRERIGYIRFDGNVSNRQRGVVLRNFHSDPTIRVALLSISCGAVGIDLTAASRAYLMEPHWNPSVEEQALARVYRIGQKRPVTTVRYSMRGSFEDHVRNVQERKLLLTDLMLNSGKKDGAGNVQEKLRQLWTLVCGS